MDDKHTKAFEAALRDLGGPRLRLAQVVRAYQQTFPADAMRPDMRQRLHDAILELCQAGIIVLPDEEVAEAQTVTLPSAIEITASAHFVANGSGQIN